MNVSPLSLMLGGIISFACLPDAGESCCPCPAEQRRTACTRAKQGPGSNVTVAEILAFEADWCGPCQKMAPVLKQLESKGIRIRRINVDENRSLANQYHVTSLPTMVKLVKGRETGRLVGMSSPGQVTELAQRIQVSDFGTVSPHCGKGRDCCCAESSCDIPAATQVETLIRATYDVPADKAAALVGLLDKTTEVPMETKIDDGKLTITTTPTAQRTIGAFINAFLRDASKSPLSACSS